jgi:hypothetical protein
MKPRSLFPAMAVLGPLMLVFTGCDREDDLRRPPNPSGTPPAGAPGSPGLERTSPAPGAPEPTRSDPPPG